MCFRVFRQPSSPPQPPRVSVGRGVCAFSHKICIWLTVCVCTQSPGNSEKMEEQSIACAQACIFVCEKGAFEHMFEPRIPVTVSSLWTASELHTHKLTHSQAKHTHIHTIMFHFKGLYIDLQLFCRDLLTTCLILTLLLLSLLTSSFSTSSDWLIWGMLHDEGQNDNDGL